MILVQLSVDRVRYILHSQLRATLVKMMSATISGNMILKPFADLFAVIYSVSQRFLIFLVFNCSNYGQVEDVRIPCQQKRMFGFVTFVSADTVKMILAKGNPHYVCGARVLVKPYREKSKLVDR